MPPKTLCPEYDAGKKPQKVAGETRVVFLSRFMRKKNFNWLARHLGSTKGRLTIDIWGPLEDPDYWEECRRITAELPSNISIDSQGPVAYEDVAATLLDYHFFILPTLGENFGHVFVEALAAGCPLVISDRTPWRKLTENHIGWDLSLEHPDRWITAIDECIAMDDQKYRKMSEAAREYAVRWLSDPALETSNAEVLAGAVARCADGEKS